MRNSIDAQSMACPQKYRQLGDFHLYYASKKRAPVLTLFIGGNHEASNYMRELCGYFWLYIDFFAVITAAGCAKTSTTWDGPVFCDSAACALPACREFISRIITAKVQIYHYFSELTAGHFEKPPLTEQSMRSIYHIREFDILRLMQVRY
jgi:lariat debranching enzyme